VTDARSQSNTPSAPAANPDQLADSDPESAPDRPSPASYLARAEKLVKDEREASKRRVFSIWMKPIPERVASGHAVEGVRITGTAPDGGIHLSCARNQSRFREVDILCLNRGDPFSQPRLMVTLDEDRGQSWLSPPTTGTTPGPRSSSIAPGWCWTRTLPVT
jgi:hypothetical protein